ncbi:ZIP family metal transporter [Exiguobacterium flavidum]|uniref:ZIP family metal transporter n=1 Tax=Exiguobacterium flavidum TaxID=2184695 RepID=UPI000DF7AD8D|nr:ZIP family metal transporter [Exiguobacterium flavidum]
MLQAFGWGALAGGAVLLGALIALYIPLKKRLIGYVMSFGTGILIGAATFELLDEALAKSTTLVVGLSFLAGALVFTVFDLWVSAKGGSKRKRSAGGNEGTGTAIFFGTILDAIPESIMIGASLLSGNVSAALVAAIFVSNVPEGLSSTTGLKKDGFSKERILFMWGAVWLISALSSLAGYSILSHLPDDNFAMIGAFASGGIIAMLASTMMPEAHEEGGTIVGLFASLGLITAIVLG